MRSFFPPSFPRGEQRDGTSGGLDREEGSDRDFYEDGDNGQGGKRPKRADDPYMGREEIGGLSSHLRNGYECVTIVPCCDVKRAAKKSKNPKRDDLLFTAGRRADKRRTGSAKRETCPNRP